MGPIDEAFIIKTNEELLARDVKLHARPFQVVIAWMREKKIAGDVTDKRLWDPLMVVYRRLYPSGDFNMPSLFTGGVAIRDQMFPARVHLGFGTVSVEPLKCIEIAPEELNFVFKNYPDQGWRAFFWVCDLWDFGYGVDDLLKRGTPAADLLRNARSSLAARPRILSGDIDIDAAVQTACLAAELAMKAALTHLGATAGDLKKLSHRLPDLAATLVTARSTSTDARLLTAASKFPDYVGTRYSSHGLTRVQLMDLARRAQFIAADSIRRISDRNMGGDMEARADCPNREDI
jgi:hypothetical protein